jgi:hypothetical protein
VADDATRCPVCGAHPDVGPLVVRRDNVPALPMRQLAVPVAAGAVAAMAAGAGISLVRRLLQELQPRRDEPDQLPPTVVREPAVAGRVLAVQRRFWAMGDRSGATQWGAEETVWQVPPEHED